MTNLVGKTREQIAHAVRNVGTREEWIDIIYALASDEPQFSVTEVATTRRISRDAVLKAIKDGDIPRDKVHLLRENAYQIKLSGLRIWDQKTALASAA